MGVSGTVRFRVIVILLLFLIIWQVYRLYPGYAPPENANEKPGEVLIPEKIVKVSVYYEALCPDSRHFFIHHLEETFPKLKNNINLQLIPYGKAKTFQNQDGLEFECQHGEIECQANKIHACAIEYIHNISEQLQFINCMIKDNMDPDHALSKCGMLFSVDTALIKQCAVNSQGSELLKVHGEATHIIKPSFIPTVLIDGSRENQGSLLKNFKVELCKHFADFKMPLGCA